MSENNGLPGPEEEAVPAGKATLHAASVRDVFVSYASQDSELANAVVRALEKNALSCWIAPRDVIPGDLYADGIIRAIAGSKVFVLLLSKNAIASNHVGKEVERASSKRLPIVALRTDATPLTPALEYFLSESQWIDLKAGQRETALTQIVQAVRRHRGGAEAVKTSVSLESAKRAQMRLWMPLVAVVGLLIVVVLYFLVDKFRGSTRGHQDRPVSATAPAVQTLSPAAPIISERSVAVLPFVDMSEKKDQEFFSDGLTEELIDRLGQIADLKVIARTSSFQFKGKNQDLRLMGAQLGVTNLLEGSVRKVGSHLRITAHLVRASDGTNVWSHTYDRELKDVFSVQDNIASTVAQALKASLLTGGAAYTAGTQNLEAYSLYLRALAINRHATTAAEHAKATDFSRQALSLDPSFAVAWAQLAYDLSKEAELTQATGEEALHKAAREAAEQALKLGPNLPFAHTTMARILIVGYLDLPRGELAINEALRLDPNDSYALAWAAMISSWKDMQPKAIALIDRAIDLDPVNAQRYNDKYAVLYQARLYKEALATNRQMLDIRPIDPGNHLFVAQILLAMGDPTAALAEVNLEDEHIRASHAWFILIYDALNRKEEADKTLVSFEKEYGAISPYELALVYASRGHIDEAFSWFDRAYRQRDNNLLSVRVDPLLKNVQSDPRFQALLAKLKLTN